MRPGEKDRKWCVGVEMCAASWGDTRGCAIMTRVSMATAMEHAPVEI